MDQPSLTISVVIPAYNVGELIGRAIDSVLAQTRPADEIIVVDDGSTDNTAEVVQAFGEKVHYIYQENVGPNTSRNTGIRAAKHQWIALLDADDEWLCEHLQQQVKLLSRNPELVWSTGNYFRCSGATGKRVLQHSPEVLDGRLGGKDYFADYLKAFGTGVAGHTDTMVIRRDALIEAGMFREGLRRYQDMDLWFRIAYRWPRIGFVSQPSAVHYLDRDGRLSKQFVPADLCRDLVARHLRFAEQAGRLSAFEPAAQMLVKGWMRAMLFDARKDDIRALAEHFRNLLPGGYCRLMWSLTIFPRVSAMGCRLISKIVRSLRLCRR